jgi:predicted RNA-binding Zn ribbon-like protein
VLSRAIALREAIYGIFTSVFEERPATTADMAVLNRELANAMTHARIKQDDGDFVWTWQTESKALDRVLWSVVRSAADLLTSERKHRVTECASDDCTWLFIDLSRNHSRRWCDMNECGNRAKAKRFYERSRKQSKKEA